MTPRCLFNGGSCPWYAYSGSPLTTASLDVADLTTANWPSNYCVDFDLTLPSSQNGNVWGYEGCVAALGSVTICVGHGVKLLTGSGGDASGMGIFVIEQANGSGPYFATPGVADGSRIVSSFCYDEGLNTPSLTLSLHNNGAIVHQGDYLQNNGAPFPTTRNVKLGLLTGMPSSVTEALSGGTLHALSIRPNAGSRLRSLEETNNRRALQVQDVLQDPDVLTPRRALQFTCNNGYEFLQGTAGTTTCDTANGYSFITDTTLCNTAVGGVGLEDHNTFESSCINHWAPAGISGCFSNELYGVGVGLTSFDIKFQACTTGTGPMTSDHQPVCGRCTGGLPPVDPGSGSSGSSGNENTVCPCTDGVGASRDGATDPCPNGENVCVSCETTNYLLIGDQCEHRPPCNCQHGVDAAPIDADCSDPLDGTPQIVYEDKCSSCNSGYELNGSSLVCEANFCSVADASGPIGSTFLTANDMVLDPDTHDPLPTDPDIVTDSSVTLACETGYHNTIGAGTTFTVPCSLQDDGQGNLFRPPTFATVSTTTDFQCAENVCECPGNGAQVTGGSGTCPVVDPGTGNENWTCVDGCDSGWSGPSCQDAASCDATVVSTFASAEFILAGNLPHYAWLSTSTCAAGGTVLHEGSCYVVCGSGYHFASAESYWAGGQEGYSFQCNAGGLQYYDEGTSTLSAGFPSNTCDLNVCPCPGYAVGETTVGVAATGTDCPTHGNQCSQGCAVGYSGGDCTTPVVCAQPSLPAVTGVVWATGGPVDETTTLSQGEVWTIGCDSGYTAELDPVSGNLDYTCSAGTITGPTAALTCNQNCAFSTFSLTNAAFVVSGTCSQVSGEFLDGDVCDVECSADYLPWDGSQALTDGTGMPSYTCSSGNVSPDPASQISQCVPGCDDEICLTCITPETSRTSITDCASCHPGYNLVSTNCVAWTCDETTCAVCVSQELRTADNQCTTCMTGYELNGSNECVAITCDLPSLTTGAAWDSPCSTGVPVAHGASCDASCGTGYSGSGSQSGTCVDGSALDWVGVAPSCQADCSVPTLPTSGIWVAGSNCAAGNSDVAHGATCDAGCPSGYATSPDQAHGATCVDGTMTLSSFTCTNVENSCDLPSLSGVTGAVWVSPCVAGQQASHGQTCQVVKDKHNYKRLHHNMVRFV